MPGAALIAVDEDAGALRDIERELRDRYARHYRVICMRSAHEGHACLEDLAAANEQVAQAMGIQERTRIGGETMLIVGSRNDSGTFPYGFFKDWHYDMNLGRFGRA